MSRKRLNLNVQEHQINDPAANQASKTGGKTKMSPERGERAYEKYAWIILSIIGLLIVVGGVPNILGDNADPETAENIVGMTLSDLKESYPRPYDLYDYFLRSSGWSDMVFGFLVVVVSSTAYRRGEKWAWYNLWSVPVFFLGHAAITMNVGISAAALLPYISVFVVLSLLGLLLPFRKFFAE